MDFLLAGVGLGVLLFAGDLLVRGATEAALRLGVPALIVSLTVVAFGTSAPELLISVDAVLSGVPELALGNVVGSNTANILLVLGLPALFSRLATSHHDVRRSYVQMIVASLVFIGLALTGQLVWWHGLLFLTLLALVLVDQGRAALRHRELAEPLVPDRKVRWWRISLYLIVGLIGLPVGAHVFVDSAVSIAERIGVSNDVIGLTLVALGTSLPELATTIAAALRRQADVALGNVIGSNLFNLLGIMGVAVLFGTVPVPESFLIFDLWVMLGASVLILPFVIFRGWDVTRRWGTLLTALYMLYVTILVL